MKHWYAFGALFVGVMQIALSPTFLLALLGFSLFLVAVLFLIYQQYHYIPKGKIAVVVNRHDEFVRYATGGQWHFLPWRQKVAGMFSAKGKDKAEGDARKVRAQKGIPLDIHWKTSYKINVPGLLGNVPPRNDDKNGSRMLSPDERADLAKAMLDLPFGAIKEATRIGIRNAVEKINVRELYTGISTLPPIEEGEGSTPAPREVGALANLENEITTYVETAVSQNKAILPQSIKVTLGPIQMPPEVEEAITRDHESWLQTETAITALEKLEQLVRQFDPSDVARLAALERLHMLAHNDVLKSYRNKFVQHEGIAPNGQAN